MTKLILVGDVHFDYKGPERLEKILYYFKPEVIAVEDTTREITKNYQEHKNYMTIFREIAKRDFFPGQLETVQKYLHSLCFQCWVPKEYQKRFPQTRIVGIEHQQIEGILSNMSEQVEKYVAGGGDVAGELFDLESYLKMIFDKGIDVVQEEIDAWYEQIEDYEKVIAMVGSEVFDQLTKERDKLFARKLKTLSKKYPCDTLVAILGVEHVFGTYGSNTFDILAHLHPTRMLLKDADHFLEFAR